MRILIDGRVLAHNQTSGVQRHAQEITKALCLADPEITVAAPRFENRYYQQFWEHTLLPFYARKYDLLFCPSNIAPIWLPEKTKLVITLHDLAFLDFPKQYSSFFQKYYAFLVPKILKRAQHIVTISNFSKERIIQEYPWTQKKISIIYHGISPYFTPSEKKKSDYTLYVGSMNEIKNFQGVLKIFLMPEFKIIPLKMILPGASTFTQGSEISTLLKKVQSAENIEIISSVSQRELKTYYQNAKLFIFPSFHESFGFPPLEAMACGTPVIISKVTALPEICGDAALYVDPNSNEDIAEKIHLLLSDLTLQKQYRAKGLAHVKTYTWEDTANAHLKIFKKAISK